MATVTLNGNSRDGCKGAGLSKQRSKGEKRLG